ncbi:MAG: DNA topoisomerase III [Cytophagales bacterium]|nr:DNA topoisomerase III [Cytophagales bacterium]
MKVCIAEKPSVAKEIAYIIGAKQRKDGYYEGNGYQVTWTFGHLCTLKEPEDYFPQLKRWNLSYLPIIPTTFGIKLIEDSGVEKQFNIIEKLVGSATEVINCGDAGQEGEVIQRWVLNKAKCSVPVRRLWISSLTEEAIRDGFSKLYDASEFDLLYAAGSARAIGDWLLGINATRLYTLKYGGYGQVLSIGRVQTPTLSLVVNRQLEINNFKPEAYWEIKTLYKDVVFNCTKGRFSNKEEAQKFTETIKELPFGITSFTKKKGKESPPKLFDLTALQVECNKKFGLTAEQTLKTVQTLYERKVVTYPRVDTTFLPNDIYPQVKGILQSMTAYQTFVSPLLQNKIKKRSQVFNDKKVTDHHAIIPTNNTASGLTGDLQKVYDTIARRFLAVFYDDCIVSKTEVLGKVDNLDFKTTGKQILSDGWRVLYPKNTNQKDKDDDQVLPEFVKGETGPHKPDLLEKETKPPKYYTEATLLRAMETAGKQVDDEDIQEALKENGIGRPSTRANIIETLFRRKYIRRNRKNIEATVTGIDLIHKVKNDLLKSAELTGHWESKFRQIERKEYDVKDLMEEVKGMVRGIVQEVKGQKDEKIAFEVEEEKSKKKKNVTTKSKDKNETCPKCQKGEVLKGKSAFGCSSYTNGCDFKVPFELFGKKLTEKQILTLISKKKTGKIKGFKLDGKSVTGIVELDTSFIPVFSPVEEKVEKRICPKCKQGEMLQGKSAFGCSNFSKGCKTIIPFEILGKKLTESQINSLIKKGKTSIIKGFIQNGEKMNAKLFFDENFQIQLERID